MENANFLSSKFGFLKVLVPFPTLGLPVEILPLP